MPGLSSGGGGGSPPSPGAGYQLAAWLGQTFQYLLTLLPGIGFIANLPVIGDFLSEGAAGLLAGVFRLRPKAPEGYYWGKYPFYSTVPIYELNPLWDPWTGRQPYGGSGTAPDLPGSQPGPMVGTGIGSKYIQTGWENRLDSYNDILIHTGSGVPVMRWKRNQQAGDQTLGFTLDGVGIYDPLHTVKIGIPLPESDWAYLSDRTSPAVVQLLKDQAQPIGEIFFTVPQGARGTGQSPMFLVIVVGLLILMASGRKRK